MIKVLHSVFLVYFYICFMPTTLIFPAETVRYISTEHPSVAYYNPKYISFINVSAQRYGRTSPIYYLTIHVTTLTPIGNNLSVAFYFYEFLSNVYKRGFIEMHFKWCDLIQKDRFIGSALRQGKLAGPCPHPPSEYHLYNMSTNIEAFSDAFPFIKGRIYANVTIPAMKEVWAELHVDIELKEYKVKKHSKKGLRGLFQN